MFSFIMSFPSGKMDDRIALSANKQVLWLLLTSFSVLERHHERRKSYLARGAGMLLYNYFLGFDRGCHQGNWLKELP